MENAQKGLPTETHKPLTLEERLEPWIASGEWVLILVIGVILWTAGFVDLFTHKSEPAQILGMYSIPFAVLMVVYALGFVFWYRMIFDRRGVTWLKAGIRYIQRRAWLGGLLLLAFIVVIGSMIFVPERWIRFPLLESALLILMSVTAGVVVFARADPQAKTETWRRVAMGIVIALVLIEVAFQILARLGVLPFTNLGGVFQPSARVYQTEEGHGYGMTNSYGFYYPAFRLEDGTERIVLTGDSFVQGLQVAPDENMGVALDRLLNEGADSENSFEAMSLGMPDYGTSVYLEPRLYDLTMEPLKPNEVIVMFHLANDFQSITASNGIIPYSFLDEDGNPTVEGDADLELRHTLWHVTLRGYDPPNPVRIVQTHLFTLSFVEHMVQRLFNTDPAVPPGFSNIASANESEPFGASSFMFETAENSRFDESMALATRYLSGFKSALDQDGVTLRLVTIPYFPASFYSDKQGSDWTSELGDHDLFVPDQALEQFARDNGIAFLSLGQFMRDSGMTVEDIRALFFKDGVGRFNASGHQWVAEALHTCFYNESGSAAVGCGVQ